MNVLFVHEVDWFRKVIFEIHTLAELLSLKGHRVYAIDYESMWVRDNPLDFGSLSTHVVDRVARAYPDAAVQLIRPGFIKIPGISRLSAACMHYREIERTIKEKNIDAVILYSVPTNGVQTVRIARKLGVPVIFRSIDILNQLVPYPMLSPAAHLLERWVYKGVNLILTISPELSRYVVDLGASEASVRLLALGIDTAVFHPDIDVTQLRHKWGLSDDAPVIVFIGTLFKFSGLEVFIPRFSEVLKDAPEARLLIVGDGPQRPLLENIIAESGLTDRVTITGFEPFDTMPGYMNLATVLINTFHITDATRDIFPGKIVQYLACGKPVVATALPGLKAMVHGEEQGIVYVGKPEDMPGELTALLKSEERRRSLGRAALDYVKRAHSYDKIVKQLETQITELIETEKASRVSRSTKGNESSK